MRKLKIISIIIGVLVLILVTIGVIFSTVYEDRVKAFIIEQINESVNTKIDVQAVEFSVFKKFPYASLEFSNVTAEEVTKNQQKGELFNAQSIYLQFNIIDILKENYIIKKVQVNDGMMNLKVDKYGNDNFHFWKPATDSSANKLSVELEQLIFEDVNFYYLNEYKDLDMDINAEKLALSGNFSKDEFSMQTEAILLVNQMNSNKQRILKNKYVYVNTELAINQKTQLYTISKGELALQDLTFILSGNIRNKPGALALDITTTGDELEIEKLFSLFPAEKKKALESYKTRGVITYKSIIKGDLSLKESPSFDAEFSITNGEVIERSSDQALTNIQLSGSFTNGDKQSFNTSKLTLNQLDADFGMGHISGNYVITNFANPYIELNSVASIDLAVAKEFFKWDSLETASGQLDINIEYNGYVKELSDIQASELRKLNASGKARLTNAQLKKVNTQSAFEQINGSFKFNNNDVQIDTFKFITNGNKFELDGKFKNLLAFLFVEGEDLAVRTNFHANKLVLADFLSQEEGSDEYTLNLPKNIALSFAAKIDTFEFRKFKAENLRAQIELEDQILTATNVSFLSMQGEVRGNLAIDAQGDKILITSKAKVIDINIHELFHQFENFNQTHISAENINGKTTTTVEFASVWDKQLKVDKEKIYVLADINVVNGELISYKPILALSKFIEVEELEHIKFDQLTTQIEVKNQTVYIPKTEVNSSALDITISGKHTFKNEIDYRFKLLLNDVLWKKAKKKKKETSEFGYIADDGLGKTTLFLKMTGTIDDYKIGYDTKGLKENWKENLKKEKNTLKKILNEEFGWFKKDTTIKKDEEPKDDGFQIEWEEEEEDKKDKENKKKQTSKKESDKEKEKKTKKKKGLGKFIDKIAKPDEEEYEEFDDL